MYTIAVNAHIEHIYNILDNLAKSQGYDCQVVTFQTQYRNAD